jgi:hypothetical protein
MIVGKVGRPIKRFIKKVLFPAAKTPPANPSQRLQKWSIGIYIGESPLHMVSPETLGNPVLTCQQVSDVIATYVADPFMLKEKEAWYMFFEVWNWQTKKGEIACATSDDGMKWTYQQIVLAESFHLSYPHVIEWMNDYYLIPESQHSGSIRLYKASEFPWRWSFVGTLLSQPRSEANFVDPSIVRHDDQWWLFTKSNPSSTPDMLRLYYADNLLGPWHEHEKNPIVEGHNPIARPAGRFVPYNGKIIRYAQQGYPVYGTQVRAYEITELTTKTYHEQEAAESPILTGSGTGWNGSGMHHIDPHCMEDGQWIACVDGWNWSGGEDGNSMAKV